MKMKMKKNQQHPKYMTYYFQHKYQIKEREIQCKKLTHIFEVYRGSQRSCNPLVFNDLKYAPKPQNFKY